MLQSLFNKVADLRACKFTKTRRPGRLLTVLCTFNLRPVSTGILFHNQEQLLQDSYLKIH